MKTIVVLGMHRSGTSAMTRALGLLGAEMGPLEHLGKHWEVKSLRLVNARLLTAAGGSWDVPPLDDDWLSKVSGVEGLPELGRERIHNEFGDAEIAVWKDPRTCLTLPFWRPVFDEEPAIVLIHRHPHEVARSLESRNSFGDGLSYALWERYNREALRFIDGMPTTVLSYSDILARPREVMAAVADQLRDWGIDLPNDPATTDLELEESARHHVAGSPSLDEPVATDSQRALFDKLIELDGPHDSFTSPSDLPPMNPLSVELLQAFERIRRLRNRADKASGPSAGANQRRRKGGAGSRRASRQGGAND